VGQDGTGPAHGGVLRERDEHREQANDDAHAESVGDEGGQPVRDVTGAGDQSGNGEERRNRAGQRRDGVGGAVAVQGQE
jgi:hypothetical protein